MGRMAEIDMMLTELEERMVFHDWYYAYSDDHGVWQRGLDAANVLTDKMNELKDLGFGPQVDALWDTHCPWAKEST